ncbi:unnamed protein product [Protopolystoma xenopodis]|uniref:Uncharacterized protein n=1 Tax=Protopolystoma xenopodis TaxID=117903 RepID=A0A448WKG0_9PLAT|nr:unnamed protein product [Protopolystoma xenopodis]
MDEAVWSRPSRQSRFPRLASLDGSADPLGSKRWFLQLPPAQAREQPVTQSLRCRCVRCSRRQICTTLALAPQDSSQVHVYQDYSSIALACPRFSNLVLLSGRPFCPSKHVTPQRQTVALVHSHKLCRSSRRHRGESR